MDKITDAMAAFVRRRVLLHHTLLHPLGENEIEFAATIRNEDATDRGLYSIFIVKAPGKHFSCSCVDEEDLLNNDVKIKGIEFSERVSTRAFILLESSGEIAVPRFFNQPIIWHEQSHPKKAFDAAQLGLKLTRQHLERHPEDFMDLIDSASIFESTNSKWEQPGILSAFGLVDALAIVPIYQKSSHGRRFGKKSAADVPLK